MSTGQCVLCGATNPQRDTLCTPCFTFTRKAREEGGGGMVITETMLLGERRSGINDDNQ